TGDDLAVDVVVLRRDVGVPDRLLPRVVDHVGVLARRALHLAEQLHRGGVDLGGVAVRDGRRRGRGGAGRGRGRGGRAAGCLGRRGAARGGAGLRGTASARGGGS